MASFEREGACDFEGHVRRIDVVIFAVVEGGAKIGDRKAGEKATGGGIAKAFFNRRNPVLGYRPAENVIHKFDALAAFDGFKFDAADTELSMAAGLLFVFAFGVGFAANGFAIRNLGGLEG